MRPANIRHCASQPPAGINTGVILGLVPRTHRAASMVAVVGARRAALPGRWPFPRGTMGPRAKPEDDGGGEAGVQRRSEDRQVSQPAADAAPALRAAALRLGKQGEGAEQGMNPVGHSALAAGA